MLSADPLIPASIVLSEHGCSSKLMPQSINTQFFNIASSRKKSAILVIGEGGFFARHVLASPISDQPIAIYGNHDGHLPLLSIFLRKLCKIDLLYGRIELKPLAHAEKKLKLFIGSIFCEYVLYQVHLFV